MTTPVKYKMLPVINAWDLEDALIQTFGFVFDRTEIRSLLFDEFYHNDSYQSLDILEYRDPNAWVGKEDRIVRYNLVLWYLQMVMPEGTEEVIINTTW